MALKTKDIKKKAEKVIKKAKSAANDVADKAGTVAKKV